jgi:hypothetical protein
MAAADIEIIGTGASGSIQVAVTSGFASSLILWAFRGANGSLFRVQPWQPLADGSCNPLGFTMPPKPDGTPQPLTGMIVDAYSVISTALPGGPEHAAEIGATSLPADVAAAMGPGGAYFAAVDVLTATVTT